MRRAVDAGLVSIAIHNIRDYALDKHHDRRYPLWWGRRYGDGEPSSALEAVVARLRGAAKATGNVRCPSCCSPAGRLFRQEIARQYERHGRVVLICGRYEGVDERVSALAVTDEISIGDYVLSGGEIPAMAIVEAVTAWCLACSATCAP